ncbi:HNH endonuclease [Micromonospora aurantiaca]|uniref:HNH endonuclease n=1 Tax=Micromonospora aurantiaca (nom. illeg.) TaxID=47850 RepID=UPI0011AA90A9|nr:HNH endonuclease signature motif containing protein [Micromonospora aurantiaca]UFN92693.1 HNH endonuclease [Micromonospora aurantiaca]
MTRRLPRGEVGYGRDGPKLHTALFEVWDGRCHSCWQSKLFIDTQVDHIIPRGISDADLREAIRRHGLPADFHVDRPRNLALICGDCNRKKSNRVFPQARSYTELLDTALKHEREVIRLVRQQATANAVAKSLTRAATANLHDDRTRDAFLQHAPAVVRSLALLDEDKVDFLADRSFVLDEQWPVSLSLDACGRTVQTIVEKICGSTLTDVASDGLTDLVSRIKDDVEAAFHQKGSEDASWTPVDINYLALTVAITNFGRHGDHLKVDFKGTCDVEFIAAAAQSNKWGDDLVQLDAWGSVDCEFALYVTWNLTVGDNPYGRVTHTITNSYNSLEVSRS